MVAPLMAVLPPAFVVTLAALTAALNVVTPVLFSVSAPSAVVRRPDIYLFDDSFSALDLATDARLRAALAPKVRDAAVIVVAQRVSTIRSADRILVLEDGEAVGIGTHDELLSTCPTSLEIVESQASINEEETV